MRKISRIEPKLPVIQARKKVAAYARVSRDTERLMHSVSAQVSYYSALIQKNSMQGYMRTWVYPARTHPSAVNS